MDKLKENLDRLNAIADFKDNWNGYGAIPFSSELIHSAKNILLNLNKQPDLFPTAQPSIQLEYECNDESYLEINIFEDKISVMQILQEDYDNAIFWDLSCYDIEQINKIINQFFSPCQCSSKAERE